MAFPDTPPAGAGKTHRPKAETIQPSSRASFAVLVTSDDALAVPSGAIDACTVTLPLRSALYMRAWPKHSRTSLACARAVDEIPLGSTVPALGSTAVPGAGIVVTVAG